MRTEFKRIYKKDDGTYYICYRTGPDEDVTLMVYDVTTRVIYYKELPGAAFNSNFLCPYISENGKYCRFMDNKIVEIP